MQVNFRQPGARAALLAFGMAAVMTVAACGGSSSSGSGSSSSGSMTLRIAYNPNPTNTSIVVADKQGFFKEQGLTVKLTSTEASAALIPSIGKQYDLITVTPPSLLQAAQQGLNPVLISAEDIENSSTQRNSYLVGSKTTASVADLKGKTIGVPTLSGNLYEGAVIMLNKAGLKKSDVKFLQVPFTDMANDLTSGTIQAAVTIYPFQGQLLGEGFKDLGDPTDVAGDGATQLSAGWIASKSWAAKNAKAITAFNKAQDEALAWMKANTKDAQSILATDFKLPQMVASNFDVTKFVSYEAKPEYLQAWIEPMKTVGDLTSSFNTSASDLVYQSS